MAARESNRNNSHNNMSPSAATRTGSGERIRRRKIRKPVRRKVNTIVWMLSATFLLAGPIFLPIPAASGEQVIRRQPVEEEVELLRPPTTTPTTPAPTSSQTSKISAIGSAKTKTSRQQQQRPHIYRIRAAPTNGNLAPPIRVLPNETFGVRAPTRSSAKLQQQDTEAAPACAKSSQEEQESAASSSSSISASSQVLRLSSSASSSNSSKALVQRLGEIEESSGPSSRLSLAPTQRQSILLQSQQIDQRPTTTTTANSILNLIDEYDSKIITNKTRAQLSCDSGEMILRLNFSEPFKGIVYPDNNRLSPCRFFGDGHHNYELRLPLRGCGTKQVAQRVFVNDVIVRFHKSLELEEDEVKTLICRYPPPLTSASTSSTSGAQRPVLDENGQNQFEFIEGKLQPPNRPPSASGGLLVAPPGGSHHHHHHSGSSAYGGTVQELVPSGGDRVSSADLFLQGSKYSPNGRPSADLIDQRSSAEAFPGNFGAGGQPARSSGGLAGYFERLSSIELLFLISSLMFLALLGLGLAGGYLCFRRRATNERRASAILRRKRRFVGSSGMLSPPSGAAGLLHLPPALRAHHHHHYQQQQQQHHHHRHHDHLHHPPGPPTTSSPDSDLSGRGLLTTASPRRPAYVFNNQAFVPEPASGALPMGGSVSRDKSLSGPVPPPKPVIGRRGDPTGIYGRAVAGPVVGRQPAHSYHHHHHNQRAGPILHSMHDIPSSTTKYASRSHGLHRAQQVYVDQPGEEEEPRELSRAKSLTCVPGQPNFAEGLGAGRRWQLEQPIVGGTLSRYPRQQQRVHQHRHRNHYLPALGAGGKHWLQSMKRDTNRQEDDAANNKYGDAWLQVSSDSEVEQNNNASKPHRSASREAKGSKLFLKSVEDSYITKFTETEHKEYMKRDSQRPFSLAEWREAIADQRRRERKPTGREDNDDHSARESSSSSAGENEPPPPGPALKSSFVSADLIGGEQQQQQQQQQEEYRSTNTNLRSLTELDVNFAKSLLRAAPPPKGEVAKLQQRTITASPGPSDANQTPAQEPDLVVSPEYDLQRLELSEGPTGGSRNSVSYV